MLGNKGSSRQGFTLLEILIVAVIMLVVTGGAIATLSTFQERQQAVVAAKAVQQLMWSAQTKARVRETPGSGCTTLDGYRVVVGPTSATLQAVCNGGDEVGNEQTQLYPSGVRATTETGTYMFFTLERGVTNSMDVEPVPTAGLTSRTLTFCTTAASPCPTGVATFTFDVTSQGAISNVRSSDGATDL